MVLSWILRYFSRKISKLMKGPENEDVENIETFVQRTLKCKIELEIEKSIVLKWKITTFYWQFHVLKWNGSFVYEWLYVLFSYMIYKIYIYICISYIYVILAIKILKSRFSRKTRRIWSINRTRTRTRNNRLFIIIRNNENILIIIIFGILTVI